MNCLNCGTVLLGKYQKKYCSVDCQKKDRSRKATIKWTRICQQCGKEFVMPAPGGKARNGEVKAGLYCSRKCRWDHDRKPLTIKESKKCVICGNATPDRHQTYCSDECRKEKERRRAFDSSSKKKVLKARKCKECENIFTPEYGNKKRDFCSDVCRRRFSARGNHKNRQRANVFVLLMST